MNRTERRAAERLANKAANKAASSQSVSTFAADALCQMADVPEPGRPFPLLSEITPARLAANRDNAQLSTGPKTAEGKSISSQNRTTHGLARHNGRFALLPTEDSDDFARLLSDLTNEHQPTTTTELALVQAMAESWWLRSRAQNLQPTCFHPTTGAIADEKQLSLLLRYENTYNRTFNTSLNQLLKLRSEKRKSELGFEAQRIAGEKHQMKKDAHYWDILKKDAETCYQLGRNVSDKMNSEAQLTDFTIRFDAELAQYNLKKGRFNTAVAA